MLNRIPRLHHSFQQGLARLVTTGFAGTLLQVQLALQVHSYSVTNFSNMAIAATHTCMPIQPT